MRLAYYLFVATAVVAACGDSFSEDSDDDDDGAPAGCNVDPWSCADSQTCWFNLEGSAYACLNQGPNAEGAACESFFGSPSCAADLFCLQVQGEQTGSCRRFCDSMNPDRACPAGEQCTPVAAPNNLGIVQVCRP